MRKLYRSIRNQIKSRLRLFWLNRSGTGGFGRFAARMASLNSGAYQQRAYLADLVPKGFVTASAVVTHPDLRLGKHVYLGDKVIVSRTNDGGAVELGDHVHLYGDSFVETGMRGSVFIDAGTHVQPGCHIHAYLEEIRIGKQVEIAPGCGFYCYDHGTALGVPIMEQALQSKGGIRVGDGAWIGYGVTVLQGVSIGAGAVVAAGAVVVHDIPENAIAAGVPARVIRYREAADQSPS